MDLTTKSETLKVMHILKKLSVYSHSWEYQRSIIKDKGIAHGDRAVRCDESENVISDSHETSWRHITLLPFIYMMKNTTWQYNVIPEIYELEYVYCMRMADYPFQMNKFCCHGAFYGDLVYKFKKIVGRVDFSDQFRKIIVRYKRIGYNINIMRQSACLVFNPITVNNFASLFNCTPVGRASDSMMAPT